MFAALTLERDPLRLSSLVGPGFVSWIHDVGGFAAVGLLFWLLLRMVRQDRPQSDPNPPWWGKVFVGFVLLAAVGYAGLGVLRLPEILKTKSEAELAEERSPARESLAENLHTFAAGCAMLAALVPFLAGLTQLRWRRIWALARLSMKEAARRRVLYVFSAMIIVFLFLNWFVPAKPEAQIRSYVTVVFWAMTPLLLMSAALLSGMSIPTDIKTQTIHTILTKPVERFEVVLGRFLGYSLLMTGVLLVLATLSLFYVLRGVHPDAQKESLKARVPVYAQLDFWRSEPQGDIEVRQTTKAENVGREWDYRGYISGPGVAEGRLLPTRSYARFSFHDLPAVLGDRPYVQLEFTFDVYRTTKGKENESVVCNFAFETWQVPDPNSRDYARHWKDYRDARKAQVRGALFDPQNPEADNKLSEQHGCFEALSVDVADYHTMTLEIPAGLIKKALESGKRPEGKPLLQVWINCTSPTQYVGMAKYDLYLRQDDPRKETDTLGFALNFYKGALGLGLQVWLLVGLCVFFSTQLGGIISFLCGGFLYLGGYFREFIQSLATKQNVGGGPVEAAFRLFGRKNLAAPLEETTATRVATGSDEVFRWMLRRFMNVLPDVERFDFTDRVANGFNIGLIGTDLLPSLLMLLGYLLPWAVLAYYMMRGREIAGAH